MAGFLVARASEAAETRVSRPPHLLHNLSLKSPLACPLRQALVRQNLFHYHLTLYTLGGSAMATVVVALPTFIREDAPTQGLLDDLHRLEGERAQIQVTHRHRASDDTAVMLQYYGMELEEVGSIIRDRLWALILSRGEDANDARVQGFFTALTTQVQGHGQAEAGATAPVDITNELDEADIAVLQLIFDDEPPAHDQVGHASAPASPVVAPASLPQPPAVLPPAVLDPPIVFPVMVTNIPLEV